MPGRSSNQLPMLMSVMCTNLDAELLCSEKSHLRFFNYTDSNKYSNIVPSNASGMMKPGNTEADLDNCFMSNASLPVQQIRIKMI